MANDSVLLHGAVRNAYSAGIVMVAAEGINYGGNCEYPVAYEEVIGVGAINVEENIAQYSAIHGVDVWVPVVNINSTYIDSEYIELDGLSMVIPH